ncbi:MAG: ferredoxin [Anaerolineae bacterium]|nr:ferredoxin [Anaerolineae bacterium]
MSSNLIVRIEREECISCATCWSNCPEFFEENPDDGLSQVVEKYRIGDNPGEGEAPEALEDCVREAADDCPVEIIHLE